MNVKPVDVGLFRSIPLLKKLNISQLPVSFNSFINLDGPDENS
jgi:hypothetical protein